MIWLHEITKSNHLFWNQVDIHEFDVSIFVKSKMGKKSTEKILGIIMNIFSIIHSSRITNLEEEEVENIKGNISACNTQQEGTNKKFVF